jgi:hypothetical protein
MPHLLLERADVDAVLQVACCVGMAEFVKKPTTAAESIGRPDGIVKTRSDASGQVSRAGFGSLFEYRSCRSSNTHPCSLIARRLRFRFVSAKRQPPLILSSVRAMLTVPRSQLMSCHFKARYSLGRVAVVSATANTGP